MQYTTRGLRRRRGTDKWEVTLSYKDPKTGEAKTTYQTVEGKTKKAAERARDALIRKLERKGSAYGSSITIGELIDEYLDNVEKSGAIEASTLYGYRTDAAVVKRYIGNVRVANVTIAVLSGWMSQMTADGYAPRSVSKPFRLVKLVMKYAMACGLITVNPCMFCKPPKIERKELNVLSRAERTRMLEIARRAEPDPLALAVELALTTGMRRGEICALRFSDINDDESVTVNGSIAMCGGKMYYKEAKTQASHRVIPMTGHLYRYLCAMKADYVRVMRQFRAKDPDAYVLGTRDIDDRPYHPTRLSREFKAFCRMNDFSLSFHDLRHTFATMLISDGVDIRTVSSYLGHANVAVTLNTYAEVDPEAKRAAVSNIQGAFDVKDPIASFTTAVNAAPFTVAELEKMLAEAREREAGAA